MRRLGENAMTKEMRERLVQLRASLKPKQRMLGLTEADYKEYKHLCRKEEEQLGQS
jgi:hypothetical protein